MTKSVRCATPDKDMSVTITSATSGLVWQGPYRRVGNERVHDLQYGVIPVMSLQEGGKVRPGVAVGITTDLPQNTLEG